MIFPKQVVNGNFLTPEPGWKCVLAFFAFNDDVPGSNRCILRGGGFRFGITPAVGDCWELLPLGFRNYWLPSATALHTPPPSSPKPSFAHAPSLSWQVLRGGEGRAAPEDPRGHGGLLPVGGKAHLRGVRRAGARLLRPGRTLHRPEHGQPQPVPRAVPDIPEGG